MKNKYISPIITFESINIQDTILVSTSIDRTFTNDDDIDETKEWIW